MAERRIYTQDGKRYFKGEGFKFSLPDDVLVNADKVKVVSIGCGQASARAYIRVNGVLIGINSF